MNNRSQISRSRRHFLTTLGLAGMAGLANRSRVAAQATVESSGLPLPPPVPRGAVPVISTVSGVISPDKLGTTLMHEHVLSQLIPNDKWQVSVELAVRWLNDAARVGIDTVVDLTPNRDARLLAEVARRTPVRIVAATGAYTYKTVPSIIRDLSEADMEARMMREVTEGIGGTNIRAGIIKVATGDAELSEWDQKIFRCAARVNQATGIPIGTHAIRAARTQFDFLVKHGANPRQTFFSHVEAEFGWGGKSKEQMGEYLLGIAREGGRLLFNNFGYDFHTPWPDLVYLLRTLCDAGYASAIFISIDAHWYWKDEQAVVGWAEQYPQVKNRPYAYMMTDAVPALYKAGFSKREVDTFLIDNPRAYFTERRQSS